MTHVFRPRLVLVILPLLIVSFQTASAQEKKPLDHEAVNAWNTITQNAISRDGKWVLWRQSPREEDGVLFFQQTTGNGSFQFDRGEKAAFSGSGRFAAFHIVAPRDSVRQAKRDKKKKDDLPKDSLGIVNLASGDFTGYARIKSFKMPKEEGDWIAILLEKALPEPDSTAAADSTEVEEPESEPEKKAEEPKESKDDKKDKDKKKKKDGTTLVVFNLGSGEEVRFEHVTDYAFPKNGEWLAFVTSTKKGDEDAVYVLKQGETEAHAVVTGKADYKQLAFDETGEQLAFVSNRNDYDADQPAFDLYYMELPTDSARVLVSATTSGVPEGWWVSENGDVHFSDSGARLFFGTAPVPDPEPDDDAQLDEEKVVVDIWSSSDPLLQPMQLKQLDREKKRSYLAMVVPGSSSGDASTNAAAAGANNASDDTDSSGATSNSTVIQLGTLTIPDVLVSKKNDGDVALGRSNLPYRQEISWDSPGYYDFYTIDVATGESTLAKTRIQDRPSLSPDGRYVTWWDRDDLVYRALATDTGEEINLSAGVPVRLDYLLHDWPYKPDAEGDAGWTDDDRYFLVYDHFDIWALDPSGKETPRNITEGVGRRDHLRFRIVDLDREEAAISGDDNLLLSALNRKDKDGGYYRDRVKGNKPPQKLVMSDHMFGSMRKADDADRLLYTRQNFREFPDLWTASLDLSDSHRLSEANPQQAEYSWGTPELVHWTSIDGQPLDGILYKPDGFDTTKKYPMMVYFYEKMSDLLNRHITPGPSRSSINLSFYVSRGYLVFVPDIPYKVGYPGESAMNAVMPGITALIDKGFVEREHIGVQGHSWGGYQIAYMVTQTNLFAAAEAGAPVSNMTSAYGGIRWGSGMSRMFQYEMTQSRIGGTLWNATLRYIHNSPLFQAPKVETPLLMMHNDGDTAVPWYQGIEFFVALRRLGKQTWLFNYNGEPHGLGKLQNQKDWASRMQQFFDYYLKDAPAPVWLKEGVPALKKGIDLGLGLETDG